MNSNLYTICVSEGPFKGRRHAVPPEGLTLGRSSKCDVCFEDPALSRSQCRFEPRGADLWVVDLASANQTLVNDKPVDEALISPADRITVGQTVIRVEKNDAAGVAQGEQKTEMPVQNAVIDLGFQNREPESEHTRKSLLRPALWTLAAILVLVVGTTLMLDPAGFMKKQSPTTSTHPPEKLLLLNYEKIEADADNIFRYEMTLNPQGVLTVKIDDLSGKNRHVRKEKKVEQALLDGLISDIESSGFFSLDKSYTGFAARPNTLKEFSLTVALGSNAHTCRITNRNEPEAFKALREKLETFSKNELGIWAIQFSSEKLVALAQDALTVAAKKFNEREVRYGNLSEAIRAYREALFYLDTVNPKPDFYNAIIEGFEAADNELDKRYQEQRFRADRAINLSDWAAAAKELRILCELIPDRADSRNKEAARKLIDVENRLGKARH
ncbi:MAG: FHA domain-containing protein [Kiritimatiellae bacterium]|nr:FHA domain-containing protein [Kiritimatiellia bacterium]